MSLNEDMVPVRSHDATAVQDRLPRPTQDGFKLRCGFFCLSGNGWVHSPFAHRSFHVGVTSTGQALFASHRVALEAERLVDGCEGEHERYQRAVGRTGVSQRPCGTQRCRVDLGNNERNAVRSTVSACVGKHRDACVDPQRFQLLCFRAGQR